MSIAQSILANPSKYSLAQLTQGVQNGIIPAYIGVPIIQEKMQEQARMKAMGQGQGQGQQPPIAEQVLQQASAQSAPQSAPQPGVDQLPSNLPQSYAGGGIVAFDEGGPVEHFAEGGTQEERTKAREEQARRDRAAMLSPFAAAADFVGGPINALSQGGEYLMNAAGVPRLGRALGIYDPDVTSVSVPRIGRGGNTPYTDMLYQPSAPAAPAAAAAPVAAAPAAVPGAGAAPAAGTVPGIGALAQRAPETGTGIVGAKPLAMPAKPDFKQSYEGLARSEFAGLGERSDERARALAEAQQQNKMEGKPFDELRKSLEEEAKQAGVEKSDAKSMAIFKAGLAMMAGTSRNALENIGKGAMTGVEDYQKAAIDLKKADKERQKQLAAIDEARRAESRDDMKTRNAQLDKANTAQQRMDELGTNAIMAGTGKDRDSATEIWKTEFSAAKSVEVANIGSAATRYSADRAADSRLQVAELKSALAGSGEAKGALTQDQIMKWRQTIGDSPEIAEYKKQLVAQYGSKVVGQPAFKEAVNQKIEDLLAKMANRTPGASAAPNDMDAAVKSFIAANPGIRQYFK